MEKLSCSYLPSTGFQLNALRAAPCEVYTQALPPDFREAAVDTAECYSYGAAALTLRLREPTRVASTAFDASPSTPRSGRTKPSELPPAMY